ncbi:MAG TPA: trehalase family glycosidase [Bacteroidota bacterium]|nr:trehalase family glycosidase [Bacteroidota bacterium]
MKTRSIWLYVLTFFMLSSARSENPPEQELQRHLARGWNTWSTYSVLSHVLLPDGLAINIELADDSAQSSISKALIGRRGPDVEIVRAGAHAYDGSYTDLEIAWHGIRTRVQTAHAGPDLVILISPAATINTQGRVILRPLMLWKKRGMLAKEKGHIEAILPQKTIGIYPISKALLLREEHDSVSFIAPAGDTIAISTGRKRSFNEISSSLQKAEAALRRQMEKYGSFKGTYEAMQSVLAWDLIYEPTLDMVIAPVSRIWSTIWNGWILFDWDTYFASYMFSLDNKALAYSNAIAITNQITPRGFIPNFASGLGRSDDRSQPPVGSYIVKKIYERYHEKWFLRLLFPKLLRWNRWWDASRLFDGFLCWGSDPFELPADHPAVLSNELGKIQAAKWESGLDNSPMYDDAPFDSTRHLMLLADVGLLSLYIMDCRALADIARELREADIARELRLRGEQYSASLQKLWDDSSGMYLNRRLDNGKTSHRLSPTLFYPFLAGVPSKKAAQRMIDQHFYNPAEFWGEWVLPSISRNDPAYADNDYWRGRIWAPMNFLVYLGLRAYDATGARKDLVEKSRKLLLKSWTQEQHVYENYNSSTGQGDDVPSSDEFYHWGALLGFMSLIENGYLDTPVPKHHH